ncbi:MAG: phosphotransferase family protein [Anaerolineales bacterium]
MNDLGNPIAMGRTAEIYSYGEGKVLKLFLASTPQPWIDKEIQVGRYIHSMQLPVPKVYERVKIHERQGVIYERVEGPTLLNELATKPWNVARYARILARLHAQVHEVEAPPELETQREWATGGIPETEKIPLDIRTRALELLESLPDGNQLCHGDFHPGNIIMTQQGPMIIDWMTTSRGVPSGDLARTLTILEAGKAPEGTPMRWLLEWIRKLLLETYLKTYLQLKPEAKESLENWRAIMAANFLADVAIPGEEGSLLAIVKRGLDL